jgi:signal transduction histidine kinase
MPLLHKNKPFGAVVGLQQGKRTIIAEDVFLEALSSVLAISYAAQSKGGTDAVSQDLLDKERLAAIIETAVTVNHEVNNPLTAILGNVQLLLLKREDLDEELKNKLRTIEASAMKIKDVTQRLMRLTTPRTVEYSDGTKMVDISEDEDQ